MLECGRLESLMLMLFGGTRVQAAVNQVMLTFNYSRDSTRYQQSTCNSRLAHSGRDPHHQTRTSWDGFNTEYMRHTRPLERVDFRQICTRTDGQCVLKLRLQYDGTGITTDDCSRQRHHGDQENSCFFLMLPKLVIGFMTAHVESSLSQIACAESCGCSRDYTAMDKASRRRLGLEG